MQEIVWAEDLAVKNCKVTFKTTGKPVIVKIDGKAGGCTGKVSVDGDKITSSSFEVKTATLDTGIELRNKHLKENYIKVKEFPVSTLTISSAENVAAQRKGAVGAENKFTGEMELAGAKKAIDGKYSVKGSTVTATFSIELNDFKIKTPSFMGVAIADKVHVTVIFDI